MSAIADSTTPSAAGTIDVVAVTAAAVADASTLHPVTAVIDGDTIEVDYYGARRRVRYIGVDTPETVHPSRSVECFGAEAATHNRELVAGQFVRLERDISDTDRYGRLLRYVYVDDTFVNERLVADGFASAYTYPPDVRYAEVFRAAEASARVAGRGLWGAGCETAAPVTPEVTDGTACLVKGNISQATGERIYHVPGCEYYERTTITLSAGEEWFCSEAEALAAGWRKVRNCP
jgi:micrococcal nuclease